MENFVQIEGTKMGIGEGEKRERVGNDWLWGFLYFYFSLFKLK